MNTFGSDIKKIVKNSIGHVQVIIEASRLI